jgi:hypothetical protein
MYTDGLGQKLSLPVRKSIMDIIPKEAGKQDQQLGRKAELVLFSVGAMTPHMVFYFECSPEGGC